MGKKRKSKVMRPWCWYCEKDFEDDKVLVTHQRVRNNTKITANPKTNLMILGQTFQM